MSENNTGGILEVGVDEETNEVIVNVPVCEQRDGFWHLAFSVAQARGLADLLNKKAYEATGREIERWKTKNKSK